MKTILYITFALAFACAPMIKAQGLDPKLQAEFDQVQDDQVTKVSDADLAPSQFPQAMNVAMTSAKTTTSHTQTRDVSRSRYERTNEHTSLDVFAQHGQHPFRGPQDLEGLGHAQLRDILREFPHSDGHIWNQYGSRAEKEVPNLNTWFWYKKSTGDLRFMDGCTHNGGKPYKNMVCWVVEEQPAPPPRPAPEVHYIQAPPQRVVFQEAPRQEMHCVIINHRNPCPPYNIVRVERIMLNDVQYAEWKRSHPPQHPPQHQSRGYAGGGGYGNQYGGSYGGAQQYGGGYGGGNPFLGLIAQIGQINIGNRQGPQHRPPPRPPNHW